MGNESEKTNSEGTSENRPDVDQTLDVNQTETKKDELEWLEVFETKKEEALKLKAEIDKTEKELDQMVYELYGLTEQEIRIVENSLNSI